MTATVDAKRYAGRADESESWAQALEEGVKQGLARWKADVEKRASSGRQAALAVLGSRAGTEPSEAVFGHAVEDVPDYSAWPHDEETIEIKDLWPSQKALSPEKLRGHVNDPKGGPPDVISLGGKLVIGDGHHRIANALADGDTEVMANVYSEPDVEKGGPGSGPHAGVHRAFVSRGYAHKELTPNLHSYKHPNGSSGTSNSKGEWTIQHPGSGSYGIHTGKGTGQLNAHFQINPEKVEKRYLPPLEVHQAAKSAWDQGVSAIDVTSILAEGEGLDEAQVRKVDEHFAATEAATESALARDAWGGVHAAKWAARVLKKLKQWSSWIAVDLDGTLAQKTDDLNGIGAPREKELARVKADLAAGKTVKVFTARVADDPDGRQMKLIQDWCLKHVGRVLPVTNEKDPGMTELRDDLAVPLAKAISVCPECGAHVHEGWIPPAMTSVKCSQCGTVYKPKVEKADEEVAKAGNGVMLAFWPDAETREHFAVEGGEAAEDLHVTLTYFGKLSEMPIEQIPALETAVERFAATHAPVEATLGGVGRFPATPQSDGKDVAYLGVHGDLQGFREELVNALKAVGVEPKNNFGWNPHVSLKMVAPHAPHLLATPEPRDVTFDEVVLSIGGAKKVYKLGGGVAKADVDDWILSQVEVEKDGDEHWVTINGNRVLIGADGKVKGGHPLGGGAKKASVAVPIKVLASDHWENIGGKQTVVARDGSIKHVLGPNDSVESRGRGEVIIPGGAATASSTNQPPEVRDSSPLGKAKEAWDDDKTATRISKASESLVKTGDARGEMGTHAGHLLDALGKSEVTSEHSYRGLSNYDLKQVGDLREGSTFGIVGLKSFTSEPDVAESYAAGRGGITVMHVEGGARFVNLEDASVAGGERVTNGTFKVTGIETSDHWSDALGKDVTVRTITVSQTGIYGRKK